MKKYDLVKNTIELKSLKDIAPGCSLEQNNMDPEICDQYDCKDEALKALKNYKASMRELSGGAGKYYLVTEYYVAENEYDEDGEWIGGGDVVAFSEMEGENEN